jgi:hypothetical protein
MGDEPHKREEDLGREVARGRSTRTPFVLFFGVNVALFGLALAIAAVVLIVVLVWRFA